MLFIVHIVGCLENTAISVD